MAVVLSQTFHPLYPYLEALFGQRGPITNLNFLPSPSSLMFPSSLGNFPGFFQHPRLPPHFQVLAASSLRNVLSPDGLHPASLFCHSDLTSNIKCSERSSPVKFSTVASSSAHPLPLLYLPYSMFSIICKNPTPSLAYAASVPSPLECSRKSPRTCQLAHCCIPSSMNHIRGSISQSLN